MARAELEERLRLADARRVKLETRVAALTKQNAALARAQQGGAASSSSSGEGGLREGLDTVKAQLKGYTKGVQVRRPAAGLLAIPGAGSWPAVGGGWSRPGCCESGKVYVIPF